jgi:hypothetical protein
MNNKEKIKPKTKKELMNIIQQEIHEKGWNCNLNFIDTSLITDMSSLFSTIYSDFNGNISEWNVSKVKNMSNMFAGSRFNGNISKWNVSNVENMTEMFAGSEFNGDINEWNVSNVTNMMRIFASSKFKKEVDKWKVYNLKEKFGGFQYCETNNVPYWFKDYKKDKKERKKQIDEYQKYLSYLEFSNKVENSLKIKTEKPNKI